MNWKVMAIGLFFSIPLFFVLAKSFNYDPRALPEELTGELAPHFSLNSLEGYEISLADTRGGPVVINFWATWCRPCIQEHGQLLEAASVYKEKGVSFLGILYGDSAEEAKKFNIKHGSAYPTLIDDAQRTNIDYGVAGVPETYILDREGRIVKKFSGPVLKADLDAVLKGLL
jgi:cytochrome c biogenesis protein CcmG/thiol:disulfide interchange protein DsbE